MASKDKSIQSGGILLHERWKLYPIDARNWELCTLRRGRDSHGNEVGGEPRWYRCGRYYQYGSIGQALLYVADQLMGEKCASEALVLWQALQEYERIAENIAVVAQGLDTAPRTSGLD